MVSKPKAKNKVLEHFDDCSLIYTDLNKRLNGKPKVGRPTYIPNERHYQVVRALCLFGANHEYIAAYVGITPKTLRKYYPELLADCKENKNYSVEGSLFMQALRGNVDACKYWLNNHMKAQYNDKTPIEINDKDTAQQILNAIARALPD
jgi:hypothetical protein